MWVDADDIWAPPNPEKLTRGLLQAAFAIGYAENECIEARFPANNPVAGSPELVIGNPMSPLDPCSFWSTVMRPYLCGAPASLITLVRSVDDFYSSWQRLLKKRREVYISNKPYLFGDMRLTPSAGIVQIRDYARETDDISMLNGLSGIQEILRAVKEDFFHQVTSSAGLDYFGRGKRGGSKAAHFKRVSAEVPGPKMVAGTRQGKRRAG
jgi:hypothetical protein